MALGHDCYWQKYFDENLPYIFCEERICSFITEPANTWSNIGYFIVALLIWRSPEHGRVKTYFFWATLALFIGSTLLHATSTWIGMFLDVTAMFFLSTTILCAALERYFNLSLNTSKLLYSLILGVSVLYLYWSRTGYELFGAHLLFAAIMELKLGNTEKGLDIKKVKLAGGTFLLAFLIWILDVKKVLCVPSNHFLTGHGVWHLLTAFSIYIFYTAFKSRS